MKNISTFSDETCTSTLYSVCYLQNKIDCSYDFNNNLNNLQRMYYCSSLKNTNGISCSYQIGDSNCSLKNACEKI